MNDPEITDEMERRGSQKLYSAIEENIIENGVSDDLYNAEGIVHAVYKVMFRASPLHQSIIDLYCEIHEENNNGNSHIKNLHKCVFEFLESIDLNGTPEVWKDLTNL